MKKNFDFKQIGRRMPYSVPEDFFNEMEKNILAETTEREKTARPRHRTMMRRLVAAITTIAAAVMLIVVFNHTSKPAASKIDGFSDVEQAFAQLNSADQAYIIQVYQDDIFLNEQ